MAPKIGTPSPFKGIYIDPVQSFWKKAVIKHGCWDWLGWKNREGYGYLAVRGKDVRASRFSYEIHKGKIPEGVFVCHSCDNPSCINPAHLWLGNNSDNMQDMRKKGRANDRGRARGEKAGNSKLTEKEVKMIRSLFKTGRYSKQALGRQFAVTGSCVRDVVNHVTWFWLS